MSTENEIPDQSGKTIIITGASSGIGLGAARQLARKNAHVIMACRSLPKAQPLADAINSDGNGKATVIRLDTTNLDTIDAFAQEVRSKGITRLDALVLNAGIMMVPYKEIPTRSAEHPKAESQMACNVVGHFYLVQALMPLIRSSPGCRIVSVSSEAAGFTRGISYDVFLCKKPDAYNNQNSYADSKLGNLLLVHELNKRMRGAGVDAFAVGAHPGYTRTNLQGQASTGLLMRLMIWILKPFSMDIDGGGLILSAAATTPSAQLPEKPYFAPGGLGEFYGAPKMTGGIPKLATDDEAAAKLWETCEELCACKSSI